MRRTNIAGFILAGILAIVPLTAFGHGIGGGGGHSSGGGHFGGAGHFGGGGHFAGNNAGTAHYGGFAGHHFAFHGNGHFAPHYYSHGYYYPFGYGINDYDYFDGDDADYSDNQVAPTEIVPFTSTIVSVQKELAQLGYYHGPIDGLIGPQTETAVRWFQSVDKLPVTGQVDIQTLKALGIS